MSISPAEAVSSMSPMPVLWAVLGAFAIAATVARWLAKFVPGLLLDRPNERSLHRKPVPRSGGVAVLAGIAMVAIASVPGLEPGSPVGWLAGATVLVAGVSLWDDFGHVSRRIRLLTHLVAAILLGIGGLLWSRLDLPGVDGVFSVPVAWVLTSLFTVWTINLYNFMDGMDGFAGGMAVFGFGALAVLGWRAGQPAFALLAACIAASAGGFLTANFPPARIFLGDLGSSSLGLLAAGLSLWGQRLGIFPLWVAWLAFSPFIVDATWTLARRAIVGEPIWEPHRSHHYQRLVLAGWGHRKTVLRAYMVMAAAAACAVAAPALAVRDQWLLIGAWGAIYFVIHRRVAMAERGGEARG